MAEPNYCTNRLAMSGTDRTPVLSLRGLSKSYAGRQVLKSIDLDVMPGEIFALLGENGAGKTTLIECITGLKEADSGAITVLGQTLSGNERTLRASIGLVPQELALEQFETVEQSMQFTRRLFGMRPDPVLCTHLLTLLALQNKRSAIVGELSGGMKRRLLIAKALYHEPAILFLDEPTAGVDLALREDMWSTITALRNEGKTIILTTHYLEEAEALADRVAVLHEGALLGPKRNSEFLEVVGGVCVEAHAQEPQSALPQSLLNLGFFLDEDRKKVSWVSAAGAYHAEVLAWVAQTLNDAGIRLSAISANPPSFERAFRAMTEGSK